MKISILMSLALISLSACDKDKKGIINPEPDCNGLEVTNPVAFEKILQHLLSNETVIEGNWEGDFGDATCYAPPVLLAHGKAACDETATALALATIEREYKLIHAFLNNPSEALIGGLGLTEVYEISQDKRVADEARQLIEIVDAAYALFNENGLLPKSMADIYGQTASTAIIAALQLQYVIKVDPADIKRRNRYVTLSSHNYLALALLSLYNETGDDIYLNKARRTMDFILKRLYSDGVVYHDLTNDQRAGSYCTGCNFQFLFILWKMAEHDGG